MISKSLLAVAAAAGVLLLPGCATSWESPSTPTGIELGDPGSQPPAGPTTASSPRVSGNGNDVEVPDQAGDGSSVLIDRVRVEVAGFVVIVDDDETVVGSAAVPAGETAQLSVPTGITESGEYEARLYADDGDARFDPSTDQPMLDDDGDIESEDFDYELA